MFFASFTSLAQSSPLSSVPFPSGFRATSLSPMFNVTLFVLVQFHGPSFSGIWSHPLSIWNPAGVYQAKDTQIEGSAVRFRRVSLRRLTMLVNLFD